MSITHYPDLNVQALDPRFERYKLNSAAIEQLWTGARWTEGPVWFGDGRYLLFSDIPNNRMLRWSEETGEVSLFRSPSNYSNGHTRDRQGRLISCEHGTRRVTRTEHAGNVTVLMDSFEGKRLNAPNDVVVKSDGSIWFTDPGYGILWHYEGHKAEPELPNRVYRLDPETGRSTVMIEEMDRPNGLCFSPDETKLYVVDSGTPKNIMIFDVVEGHDMLALANGTVFADMAPGTADGIRTDTEGNLWSSVGWGDEDGVYCFAPDGDLIGKILLPEVCANLCFGGIKKNRLFITASQSVYALYVDALGAQTP